MLPNMTTEDLKAELTGRAEPVRAYLESCLDSPDTPDALVEAMRYSLLAGGKRLRPVLCLASAGLFGAARDDIMPFACAIELIHTYSLVHDDLPAMDDDDLRRGKPTSHKQFGEAVAILAGDALLTEAFGLMALVAVPSERVVRAMALAARAAGAAGMVGGQVLDMAYTAMDGVSLDELRRMHALKTGALIRMSCQAGAVLAGAPEPGVEAQARYGAALGLAFQIADDILDEVGDEAAMGKPVGSDRAAGKTTYVSLVGLDESRRLARAAAAEAVAALDHCAGDHQDAAFLRRLATYVVERAA